MTKPEMTALKLQRVKQIADAVLYEGYLLYPYRRSALKNRQRWTFGRLYPRLAGGPELSFMQAECLVIGDADAVLGVRVRFFQLTGADPIEREVTVADLALGDLLAGRRLASFSFPPVTGTVELDATHATNQCAKLTVRVVNESPLCERSREIHDDLPADTLVSVHAVLDVRGGQFVSLLDPPDSLRQTAASCRNVGMWPVLVGDEGEKDMILAAPIILYDYPKIAPESPGDWFDGTEMDELLSLRVLTLSEDEKREIRAAGGHACTLLKRTEELTPDQMLHLHGAVRNGTALLRQGARVRLKPYGRSDAMDMILHGKTATVVAVEQDYEGQLHLAVTIDEDPGKDLGQQGKPGHRFFFRPEEVELVAADGEVTS